MSPRYTEIEIEELQENLEQGVVSQAGQVALGRSGGGRGRPMRSVKLATNLIFRPKRGFSVRPGFQDTSRSLLPEQPTTLAKHYLTSGNRLFAFTNDGAGGGKCFRHTGNAEILQTLPFTPSSQWWHQEMANGLLIACQRGGSYPPAFFSGSNPANTWHSLVLPKPGSAPTFNANSAGGSIPPAGAGTNKTYYYRVRWRYNNGSSKASPVSAGQVVVQASGNYTINVIVPVPGSPRSDYVGWTLERTKQNGSATGPFYLVADGTAGTYADGAADSSLFYETDETIHGEPVAMDGVIFHKGRLFGWYDSNLYMSQPITGNEATGICNWVGDAIYPVAKDDGDRIQLVLRQSGRLVILKQRSVHTLDGDDEFSFTLGGPWSQGYGCAGPRAADVMGGTVIFYAGDGRLFAMKGNRVDPIAADEMGEYLADIDPEGGVPLPGEGQGFDRTVIRAVRGDYVIMWYTKNGGAQNDDMIVFDTRAKNWTHWAGYPAIDALVQKDESDFNNATLLFADPRLSVPSTDITYANRSVGVVWNDGRAATRQVYANWLDSETGAPQIASPGLQLTLATSSQSTRPVCAADNAGNLFVSYLDFRSGSCALYVQKVLLAGTAAWTAGGVVVANVNTTQTPYMGAGTQDPAVQVIPDDAGGCSVFWCEQRTPDSWARVFMQRFNSSGVAQLTASGVRLTTGGTAHHQSQLRAFRDGTGGFYLFWLTDRFTSSSYDGWLYGQHVDASGTKLWTDTSGKPGVEIRVVRSSPTLNRRVAVCLLTDGGILAAGSSTTNSDASQTVTRIDPNTGAVVWTTGNMIEASDTGTDQRLVVPGISGDAYLVYKCSVAGTNKIKVQRINCNVTPGSKLWAGAIDATPTVAASAPSSPTREDFDAALDGAGGFTMVYRGATGSLYSARVAPAGTLAWGDVFTIQPPASIEFLSVISDAAGGIVVVGDSGVSNPDIYAQKHTVDATRQWPTDYALSGATVAAAANDQRVGLSVGYPNVYGTPYPISGVQGFHIWHGLAGEQDAVDIDGLNGTGVPIYAKSHRSDAGEPGYDKDYDWLRVLVERGDGDIVAVFAPDIGPPVTLTFSPTRNAPKYNTGLLYNNGVRYATRGRQTPGRQLPMGTLGRAHTLELSGVISGGMELGGWESHAWGLPRKEHP